MSLKKWQHLKIPFTEIKDATKNFEKRLGRGGYGDVYYGELAIRGKHTKVAVKRLNDQFGQGLKEFLTEIDLLSGQDHENLISILGYCDDGQEKILVYEYAERGSLDRFIKNRALTWIQRLKICVCAARGLDHLHNHAGKHQTIIHRDIKSANILIDENWVAKISDLGLSKLNLAGLDRSAVVSYACGTPGYCEPEYITCGVVKKESDVYSFGMVLFEVICGRLCNVLYDDGFMLSAKLAKDFYEKEKFDEIVDPSLRTQMCAVSMEQFSTLAYRCLQDDRKQRPPMDVVKKELAEILKLQVEYNSEKEEKLKSPTKVEFDTEEYWKRKLPNDIQDILKSLDSPPSYSSSRDLYVLLRKGVLFDHGSRVFSINEDGIKCETLLSKAFLKLKPRGIIKPGGRGSDQFVRGSGSRNRGARGTGVEEGFAEVGMHPHIEELNLNCQISTSMLSLGVMYAARLICSFGKWYDGPGASENSPNWVWIKWQCQDLRVSSAHYVEETKRIISDPRFSSKWKTTLWHFVNNDKNAYFNIVINRILGSRETDIPYVMIHGIEFQPVDMKKLHTGTEGLEGVSISDENDMPSDGVLIDNGRKWLSICKTTSGKCLLLPAIEILSSDTNPKYVDSLSISESRFKEVIRLKHSTEFGFKFKLDSDILSYSKSHSCYLVFKFLDGYNTHHEMCLLRASLKSEYSIKSEAYAHLKLQEPINIRIVKPTKKIKFHDSWNAPKSKGSLVPKWCIDGKDNYFMRKRNDGWMEVQIFKLSSHWGASLDVNLKCVEGPFYGFIVQGIEFRPM